MPGNRGHSTYPKKFTTQRASNGARLGCKRRHFPTWKEELLGFGDTVAITGVRYVTDGKQPLLRRILWIILILTGACLMIYQIRERIQYFYTFPTKTIVNRKYAMDGLEFPTVTICPENKFQRSAVKRLGLHNMFSSLHVPWRDQDHRGPIPDFSELHDLPKNQSWRDIYHQISQPKKEMFEVCQFGGVRCDPSNFSSHFTDMGYCHAFNAGSSPLVVKKPGSLYGLWLIMNMNRSEYMALNDMAEGFRIVLHPLHDWASPFNQGIRIAPGSIISVEISMSQFSNLEPPHGPCDSSAKLDYFPSYSMENCLTECRAKYIVEHCNCTWFGYADVIPGKVCTPLEDINCVWPIMGPDYFTKDQESKCHCPVACSGREYGVSISYASLSELFLDYMAKEIKNHTHDSEWYKRNWAAVVVYFPNLQYMQITEMFAYSLSNVLCDMGGALGLLLGSTFLTIFEIFDSAAWMLWKRRQHLKSLKAILGDSNKKEEKEEVSSGSTLDSLLQGEGGHTNYVDDTEKIEKEKEQFTTV